MAGQDSDPILLSTSQYSPGPSSEGPAQNGSKARPRTSQPFYILPPRMPSVERKQYKSMPEMAPKSAFDYPADEVVGFYTEADGKNYYYARFQGGIIHKFPAADFKRKHRDLIETYKTREEDGTLPPFDPSSSEVHPKSRVTMTVRVNNNRAKVHISSRGRSESSVAPDSEEEEEDSEEDPSEDEDFEANSPAPVRRLTRSRARPLKLPYSPHKTRTQKVYTVEDSDEEDASGGEDTGKGKGTRRSTRNRKVLKINLNDNYSDGSALEDSEGYQPNRKSKAKSHKAKKPSRGQASRPAYGHFRPISELEYEYDSDEESVLRRHRNFCEKCHLGQANLLLAAEIKRSKNKGRKKRKTSDDELEESGDEQEKLTAMGGWVRCLKCPVTAHWKCLARTQQDEILKAARNRDRLEWSAQPENAGMNAETDGPKKRVGLGIEQTTEFICGSCMKGGFCMGCMETAIEPDTKNSAKVEVPLTQGEDVVMADASVPTPPDEAKDDPSEFFFRCLTCKRLSHYDHLPTPSGFDDADLAEIAQHYQGNWLCGDCASYDQQVDKILAWRPYPTNAVEPPRAVDEPANYKSHLPREYLVKWNERGYRRTTWVPHMWLLSTHMQKLKNFLATGSKIELLEEAVSDKMDFEDEPSDLLIGQSRDTSVKPSTKTQSGTFALLAMPDAENRIPIAWKTADRVLDVLLWRPQGQNTARPKKGSGKGKGKGKSRRVETEDEDDSDDYEEDEETKAAHDAAFDYGEQPDRTLTETIEQWEERTRDKFSIENIDRVVWCLFKWQDLGYDEATRDSPPRLEDPTYPAFETAMQRFLAARDVQVPKLSKDAIATFENRKEGEYRRRHKLKDGEMPDLGQGPDLKLMDFQRDGFDWLCDNWWNKQPCILADEMGLGKTVQITTFIGKIAKDFKAFPALVVVPNSTITNWVREFERWAPELRVVPFYGEARSREIVKQYELSHSPKAAGTTGAKFHVLVATYEVLLNARDFAPVFKSQPRWEVLVIDEGQRLKSDTSLLFKKLNELNAVHRIIMTGTPLNNNIRELFNLMNFLDPAEWNDLDVLAAEYEELTEDLVKQLHERLRPYFLRRIKADVLKLPPKNEVIVPLSMAPLQKEIYRSILSHNLELLKGLNAQATVAGSAPKAGRINNVLMQLRKCLQHPYLYDEGIEPRNLPARVMHEKLIDGSAKLRFLKVLLPKLKARGHRVLLFSQFVIALNVIEDFLIGEGLSYLRLDGNTGGKDRQKGMDEFNRPGSDVFIYLLSTRAGGVGINLFSADTVIIFDPDFNPHQDLQAIARAHRFGQQKTVLVFKLMVKNSAEERIVQIGKKKLVLDHLIVQKMDDDDSAGENVQSILTHGAKALFDSEEGSGDIVYTENDIDSLIEKTEKEGDQEETVKESFSFAKIWTADKDTLEEVVDEDQGDSWAQTLLKITAERSTLETIETAATGRGVRRKAALSKPNLYVDGTPVKPTKTSAKGKAPEANSDGSAYSYFGSDNESDHSAASGAEEDPDFEGPKRRKTLEDQLARYGPLASIQNLDNREAELCGLCETRHGEGAGACRMTESSQNLVEYREILMLHADDEPFERRLAAIKAIDEQLWLRHDGHLLDGQPLHVIERVGPYVPPIKRTNKALQALQSGVTGPSAQTKSNGAQGMPVAGPSRSHASSSVAGSSKRPSSPSPMEGSLSVKKAKPTTGTAMSACPVCKGAPHELTACPVVNLGPKSVSREIVRLDQVPGMTNIVNNLRKILSRQKKMETIVVED